MKLHLTHNWRSITHRFRNDNRFNISGSHIKFQTPHAIVWRSQRFQSYNSRSFPNRKKFASLSWKRCERSCSKQTLEIVAYRTNKASFLVQMVKGVFSYVSAKRKVENGFEIPVWNRPISYTERCWISTSEVGTGEDYQDVSRWR